MALGIFSVAVLSLVAVAVYLLGYRLALGYVDGAFVPAALAGLSVWIAFAVLYLLERYGG